VRDARTWPEQQHADCRRGQVSGPRLGHGDDCIRIPMDDAAIQVDERRSLGDRLERANWGAFTAQGYIGGLRHALLGVASVNIPQPYARPCPMPLTRLRRSCSGSLTSRWPMNSRRAIVTR